MKDKKIRYVFVCVLFAMLLFGCKQKGPKITVFDGLPESKYVSELKAAIEDKKPVAVSFTAEWCPHCRNYKPVFFDVKNLYDEKITFINIDVDDNDGSAISDRFQVRGIPTTAFIRQDGSVFKVQVGEIAKDELIEISNNLLESKRKGRGEPVAPFPIEPVKVKEEPQAEPLPQELIKEEVQGEEIKDEEGRPPGGRPEEVIENVKPSEAEDIKEESKEEDLKIDETRPVETLPEEQAEDPQVKEEEITPDEEVEIAPEE